MNTFITAVALAITLLAAPAITQSALAASPNDVVVNGKNIGSDPDAGVRYQMRRDVGSEGVSDCKTHRPSCCRGPRDICFGRDSPRCQSPCRSYGERHRECRSTKPGVPCTIQDHLAYPRNYVALLGGTAHV